jgi:Tol biopolymer transport system component
MQSSGTTFSPNGRWIAYSSNQTGRPEVYVLAYPGSGPGTPVTGEGGDEPTWSPDGERLYIRHEAPGAPWGHDGGRHR